ARADARKIDELIDELIAVRHATKAFYDSFDEQALRLTGISWEYEISVLALGFTIVGHQIHHLKIIEERYYPLTTSGHQPAEGRLRFFFTSLKNCSADASPRPFRMHEERANLRRVPRW